MTRHGSDEKNEKNDDARSGSNETNAGRQGRGSPDGLRVDFIVAGSHPEQGFAFTDALGQAAYSDPGDFAGSDLIEASLGKLSDTSTVTWLGAAAPPSIAISNVGHYPADAPLNDATYLTADAGIGYRLHRSSTSCLTGIAPTVGLHHNTSLQEADSVALGGLCVGNFGDRVEAWNLTAGATFRFGPAASLAVGYVAPLGGGADQQLDGGLRVLLDYSPPGRF